LNKFIIMLCAITGISCGFMDLRDIGISITPDKTDSILPYSYSPVIIKFDTAMNRIDTESALQIISDFGVTSGDKFWTENSLYFVPLSGWTAGIRYTLSLTGIIRSADGREQRIERFISFYAVNNNAPPLLEWHSPLTGSSVGTNNVVFEYHFSRPMDRLSVESALTIESIGNKTFEWSSDDKNLKVIPENNLSPWIIYRWNIKDSAKSIDGVPAAKAYSGYITTDKDQILPCVTGIYPVLNADGIWYPTGLNIETGLGPGHGIAVEFSKSMGENVLRSLRIDPSLTGRTEFLSEKSIVYIFTRDPDPEITYTLTVSGDARDSEGLKTGADYRINFTPDILFLNVLSLSAGGYVFDFNADNALDVKIEPGTGLLNISIHFSFLFGIEEMQNTPQRITLNPFFPRTIAPVALQYVNWISDDRLLLRWEGLTASDEYPHYYKLVIPGGKSGISSGVNVFMKEDIVLYLEVTK